MVTAEALGAARGSVDSLVERFDGKMDRRNLRPVATAFDKQADLGTARAYLYDTTSRTWEPVMAGDERPRELRAGMRLACTHAVTSSVNAVDRAHSSAGASTIYTASPLDLYCVTLGPLFPRRPQRRGPRLRLPDDHGLWRPTAPGSGAVVSGLPANLSPRGYRVGVGAHPGQTRLDNRGLLMVDVNP